MRYLARVYRNVQTLISEQKRAAQKSLLHSTFNYRNKGVWPKVVMSKSFIARAISLSLPQKTLRSSSTWFKFTSCRCLLNGPSTNLNCETFASWSIFSWRIFCLGAIVNNRLHYLVETIQSSSQSWAWNVFTVAVKERHSIQLTVSYYVNNNQSKRKPKPLSRLEAISWWAELSEVHFKRCSRVPLIFATKATRMESVRARAALVRLGSSQISKRLTLVAVANDGFILSCTRRPSLVREKEEKKNRTRQSIT